MPIRPMMNLKNVDMLDGLRDQMGDTAKLVQTGQPQRADGTPITNPEELKAYYKELSDIGGDVRNLGMAIEDVGDGKVEMNQQVENAIPLNMTAKTFFSLKSAQMLPLPPAENKGPQNEFVSPDSMQGGGNQGGMGQDDIFNTFSVKNINFKNAQTVRDVLEAIGNPEDAVEEFFSVFGQKNGLIQDPNNADRVTSDDDAIRDPINEFFSTEDDSIKNKVAQFLFDTIISDSSKEDQSQRENTTVSNPETQQMIASLVKHTNEIIKKLAEQKFETKSFNFKKEAQHKALENVMMYGPEDNKTDAFTGQPISDWHLVERNKGFGLKVDNVWNIDWETLWRENVMDKYSPPTRDKDGNWVGGYIQDRFEVDKNIPVYNNMQLKPGERRRPTPPELSHTEARLEALRGKEGNAFNWAKEASSKKKVLGQAKNDNHLPELPSLDGPKLKEPQRWCNICGSKMKNSLGKGGNGSNPNECPSCHAIVPTPLTTDPQLGRSPTGPIINPTDRNQYVPQGVNLQSSGGVFFNGSKFLCYSQNQKHLFNTFDEAEAFNKVKNKPLLNPNKLTQPNNVDEIEEFEQPVTGQMSIEQQEKYKTMNDLGI